MKKRVLAIILSLAMLCTMALAGLSASAEDPAALKVTGVGIFDQTPNKGIHTFSENAKLIQVTFNRDFWESEANFVELNEAINLYLKINGKTPSEWVGDYGSETWGCITAHVKRSDALGQYIEINLTGVEGLPTEATDSTIEFLPGFAGQLEEGVTYTYTGGNNVPYVMKTEDGGEENPAGELVTGVGIFDQTPNKGIHDFGTARLIQVKFGEDFYDPAQLNGGVKQWVQSELGDFIKINGKTVSEWNTIEFNSVQIHVKTSDALGGQYLEINTSALEGLPLVSIDNTVEILKGFPVFGKAASDKTYTFVYKANENVPFTLKDNEEPDGGDDGEDGDGEGEDGDNSKPEEKPQPEGLVTGVGIFDQTPNKGIQDFGTARLIQVKFSEDFYDPAQLNGGVKQWVQSELGDYIKINGKTASEWNAIEFNSVQIHVKTSDALGGQYLEINTSALEGLPLVTTDNTVEILKGFPVFGKAASDKTYTFAYKAGQNVPFTLVETEIPETGSALPAVPFAVATAAGVLTAGAVMLRKKRAA